MNSAANDIEILTNTTCLSREEGMNLIQSHLFCPYMYLVNGAALGVCRTWTLEKDAVIVRIAECGILGLHHTNDGYARFTLTAYTQMKPRKPTYAVFQRCDRQQGTWSSSEGRFFLIYL